MDDLHALLADYVNVLKADLAVDLDVDIPGLLDMTKTAAHNVARPAAPLTAFLVGYAAAAQGGGAGAVAAAMRAAEDSAAAYRPGAHGGAAD